MHRKLAIGTAVVALFVTASRCGAQDAEPKPDWQTMHDLAMEALALGDREAGRRYLIEAMSAADAAGEPHVYFERSMMELGRIKQRGARYREAEIQYRRALLVRQARLGPDDPELAELLDDLAVVCAAQGKISEAASLTEQALAIQEARHGSDHLAVGVALYRLAAYAIEKGRLDAAEAYLRRSLPITNASLGNSNDVPTMLESFAATQLDHDRDSTAEALYRRALALHDDSCDDADLRVQSLLLTLGLINEQRGHWKAAEQDFERAFHARPGDAIALRLWLARARQGDRTAADRFLNVYASTRRLVPVDDWHGRVMEYLLGRIEAETLLETAASAAESEQVARACAAHFFIGSRLMVTGDAMLAFDHFQQAVGTDARGAIAYRAAQAQMAIAESAVRITQVESDQGRPDF